MTPGDKTPSRQRLRTDLALMHEEGACLPLRSTHGQCHACADVCPVQALRVTVAALVLSDACTGCGRCTAACPTQALALPEMAILALAVPPVTGPMTLRVECRKVPTQAHAGETLVLPCLGALTPGHLLARAAAGIEVQIIDRDWCHGCEVGCSEARPEHPASHALEAAALWLDSVGSVRRASLVHEPLPLALRPAAIPPAPLPAPALDRRRFFRAALERPAGRQRSDATPMGGDGRAAYPVDARQPSPERERQRLALEHLAQDRGTAMPAEFFPQLHADARCCDRRMCVALCPTAALSVADDGAAAHLQWSSERCISCGTCVRACPDAALSLSPHGGKAGMHTLASHLRTRCSSCGDSFTPTRKPAQTTEPALCPACSKSRHFMHDARRQLFGALN
ncbi:MAG: 4Fe-4S binding protein [Rubrivivax sp.]|nr:4Fe-4S binding protein [Rubrivivax sp.]